MLNFALNNGRSIRATELHVSYTYAGLIQGPPDDKLNSEILDDIIPTMQRLFPNQPVHNLPPTIKIKKIARRPSGLREAPVLPKYFVAGLFASSSVRRADSFGSLLVLVWFHNKFPPIIGKDVKEQIKSIDWDTYAIDYEI